MEDIKNLHARLKKIQKEIQEDDDDLFSTKVLSKNKTTTRAQSAQILAAECSTVGEI